MRGFAALSQRDLSSPPQVGDLVTLEILIDEKVGDAKDTWKIGQGENWVPAGSITLSANSLRVVPSAGNTTKIAIDGIVHQAGALSNKELTLLHVPSNQEVKVVAGSLSLEAKALAATQTPPPWTLPSIPFGGWNFFLIAFAVLLVLVGIGFGLRKLFRKVRNRRKLNHRDRAIQALQNLQKYARNRKAMQQEEWKKFSFELAGIIRKFSDENFRMDSSDMTDREFLVELRMRPKAREAVESLAHILSTIDEVRYGRKALDVTIVPGLLLDARQFTEKTYDPIEESSS